MAMTTELNMVEGFNPTDYARTITDADGQQSQYLDVQYRKMWFRLRNPNGKIVKKICNFDGNLAVVEARIYLDRNDPPENYVSNAFAQRFIDPANQDYGNRYLESAETAAVGRALADAGYGLQFCLERDPTPVDVGQQFFGQLDMMPVEDSISTITETSVNPYPKPDPVKTQIGTQGMMYSPGYQMSNSQQGFNPQYGNIHQPAPAAPVFTNQMTVDQIVQNMPYEEAVKVVYHVNSKHNGKTFGQIAVEYFSSIKWLAESYRGDKNLYKGCGSSFNLNILQKCCDNDKIKKAVELNHRLPSSGTDCSCVELYLLSDGKPFLPVRWEILYKLPTFPLYNVLLLSSRSLI